LLPEIANVLARSAKTQLAAALSEYAEKKLNAIDTSELFAAYPHIAKKIAMSWGEVACRELLMSLISDSRDGARAGFSPQNAKTIFALLKRHDVLYPRFDKSSDIWVLGRSNPYRPASRPVGRENVDWRLIKYAAPFFALILFVLMFKAHGLFF
jgi:hypothetical protein